MRKTLTILGLAGVLTFGAAACGDDSDDSEVRDSLVEDLGLTSSQADCVIDELGGDADVILKLEDEDFVPSEDEIVALDRAGDECGLE